MIASAVWAAEAVQIAPTVPTESPEASAPADPLLEAEILIVHKRNAEAEAILLELEKRPSGDRVRDNQIQFLLALLDMADKDFDTAISRFRRILVSEPKNVRVRLEMGRAFFEQGRYADAERQFLYARAGKLPPAVLANVDRFLSGIRALQTVSYGLSFAIAPDSNLNAGPATDSVSLFGLPFQLSPNAKANSGVGISVDANAEWAPRIGQRAKWRFGALLHRNQYRQTGFDDMTLAFFTGPHVSLRRWDLNLLGNVSRRWFGDRGYATRYGPSADATYFVNPHLGVGVSANLGQIDYDLNPLQNGVGRSATATFFFTPTPASMVSGTATSGRQDAKIPAYAFNSRQFGLSYTREFAGGITAGVSPTLTIIGYDAALAAFPVARHDRQYAVQVTLLERKIDFHGLTPGSPTRTSVTTAISTSSRSGAAASKSDLQAPFDQRQLGPSCMSAHPLRSEQWQLICLASGSCSCADVLCGCALKVECTHCSSTRTLSGNAAVKGLGLVDLRGASRRFRCIRCGMKAAKLVVLPPV